MQLVPLTVGRAARAWDDQHDDVRAAARQIGGASTGGFTAGVAGAASRFAITWQRHTTALADQAEARAHGLRTVVADLVATDETVGFGVLALHTFPVHQS